MDRTRYLQDRSGTGYELVWTITGSDRSCNRKKPCKTAVDRSLTVSVLVLSISSEEGPVSVSVFPNMDEKLNRTGLPSTRLGGLLRRRITIEFIKKKLKSAPLDRAPFWTTTQIYVCSRALSGGRSHYVKKHNWKQAIPVKKSGCKCHLTVKFYPNTEEVLGMYTDEHSHKVGNKNSWFT